MKLKLTYIRFKGCIACPMPHYDLHTDEKKPINIACIASSDSKIIKKMVRAYNLSLRRISK